MKLIEKLIFLHIIILCGIHSSDANNTEKNETGIVYDDIVSKMNFLNEANSVKFITMNMFLCVSLHIQELMPDTTTASVECQLEALEQLGLFSLVSKANINDECAEAAADVFGRTFAQKFIKLENPLETKLPVIFENDFIRISDTQAGFDILKYFGHLISKIALHFDYSSKMCQKKEKHQLNKLLNYVNEYARDSVVQFEIIVNGCKLDIFSEIKDPFPYAKSVLFHILPNDIPRNDSYLNETFPRVEHLELNFEKVTNLHFINGTFEKLNDVLISAALFDKSMETEFINFTKKNPNITHLSIVSPTKKALLIINTYWKKLEELRILNELKEGPSCVNYYFPSIKRLILRFSAGKCTPPKKTIFGSMLKEITISCDTNNKNEDYFTFIHRYPKIRKLSAGIGLNNTSLRKLIGNLPDLSEASFDFVNDVTIENIVQFITNTSNVLNIVRFYHPSTSNPDQYKQRLEEFLGIDFSIQFQSERESIGFIIERKVPIKYNRCSFIVPCYKMYVLMFMYFIYTFILSDSAIL